MIVVDQVLNEEAQWYVTTYNIYTFILVKEQKMCFQEIYCCGSNFFGVDTNLTT